MTPLIDALLREGLDDWVPFRSVHALAHSHTAESDERSVRHRAIDTVRELLTGGLVEIGTVTDSGFTASAEPLIELADFAPGYLAAKTSTEDDWGYRFWLSNTSAGDRYAQQLE
jgi:hypothetical protein